MPLAPGQQGRFNFDPVWAFAFRRMDGLSISASVIAVLQATGIVLSICYDFRAIITKAPWELTRLIEETRGLRDVLEKLEGTARANSDERSDKSIDTQNCLGLLCAPENGVLVSCLAELKLLEAKIDPYATCSGVGQGKRRAFFQALGWQLKNRDAKAVIKRLERYKNTLSVALTVDQK